MGLEDVKNALQADRESYFQGFADAEDDAYDEGKDEGYNAGYLDGYDDGHNEGRNEGVLAATKGEPTYAQGVRDGYKEGYFDAECGVVSNPPSPHRPKSFQPEATKTEDQ